MTESIKWYFLIAMTVTSLELFTVNVATANSTQFAELKLTLPVPPTVNSKFSKVDQYIKNREYANGISILSELQKESDKMVQMSPRVFGTVKSKINEVASHIPAEALRLYDLMQRRDAINQNIENLTSIPKENYSKITLDSEMALDSPLVPLWVYFIKNEAPIGGAENKVSNFKLTTEWDKWSYPNVFPIADVGGVWLSDLGNAIKIDPLSGVAQVETGHEKSHKQSVWKNSFELGGVQVKISNNDSSALWHFGEQLGKGLTIGKDYIYKIERNLPLIPNHRLFKTKEDRRNFSRHQSALIQKLGSRWVANQLYALDKKSGKVLWTYTYPRDPKNPDFGRRVVSEPVATDLGVFVVVQNSRQLSLRCISLEGKEVYKIVLGEIPSNAMKRQHPCGLVLDGRYAYVLPGTGALLKVDLLLKSMVRAIRYQNFNNVGPKNNDIGNEDSHNVLKHIPLNYHMVLAKNGKLVCMPSDSNSIIVFDLNDSENFKLLWEKSRDVSRAMWIKQSRLFVSNNNAILAYNLETGEKHWELPLKNISGLGAWVNSNTMFIPTGNEIKKLTNMFDSTLPKVSVVKVLFPDSSKVLTKVGNLTVLPSGFIAAGPGQISGLFSVSHAKKYLTEAYTKSPDLALKIRLAEIFEINNEPTKALSLYKQVNLELTGSKKVELINEYIEILAKRKLLEINGQRKRGAQLKRDGYWYRHELMLRITQLSPLKTSDAFLDSSSTHFSLRLGNM